MTTELVILLTIVMFVLVAVFGKPAQSFDSSGPKLGMRVEKQIETGVGFTQVSQNYHDPISWSKKN